MLRLEQNKPPMGAVCLGNKKSAPPSRLTGGVLGAACVRAVVGSGTDFRRLQVLVGVGWRHAALAGEVERSDPCHVAEMCRVELHAVFLLDVGAPPVDADERQHALEPVRGDGALQKGFALEGTEHRIAEAEAELGAFAAGEMREIKDEAEPLHGERLDAFFEQHLPPNSVNVVTKEHTTAIEADGMDIGEAGAADEVVLEAVAVAARDEDGTIRGTFLDARGIDLLEEVSPDELFGQYKIGIQRNHQ